MQKLNRAIALTATSLFVLSCSSNDSAEETPAATLNPISIEAENWAEKDPTATLDWLPIELDSNFGDAAKLVAQDSAQWSVTGLPTLTYEINFTRTGRYQLNVHGRHDSSYPAQPDHNTFLTFGSDDGDVEFQVNGFDDQWQWFSTDIFGQSLIIEVKTAGVHQFKIASAMTGLMLDQVSITNVQQADNPAGEPVAQNDTSEVDHTADDSPLVTITDHSVHTNDVLPLNAAPVVETLAPISTPTNQSVLLTGKATDDGLPQDNLYYYWSQLNGPGHVVFEEKTNAVTNATFDMTGIYKLQLTVGDGELYTNREVQVTVTGGTTNSTDTNNNSPLNGEWKDLKTKGQVTARHETGGVVVNGKLYVIGGRYERPVDVYDPETSEWKTVANAPMEMHHFQPVAIGHKIYVVGAFTCCYPVERVIEHVYVFDTRNNSWSKGPAMPAKRQRGGAGAAVYNGKIYLVGGNTNGHSGGAVGWFDEFDPNTGSWKVLPSAPDARDHATIAIINGQLVAAAGRESDHPNTFLNTVSRTNVYDFKTGQWSTEANIPTARAGTMTVAHNHEVVVIGGESKNGAHDNVEAYNVITGKWRKLNPLNKARHSGAAALINGVLHVVSGSERRGGGGESSAHEVLIPSP